MNTITWNDGLGSRSRKAGLWLVKQGLIYSFKGVSLEGICAVVRQKFQKNGKWSNTTFEIVLAEGVVAVPVRQGWESGTWAEGMAQYHPTKKQYGTWEDWFASWATFGVSAEEAERFCREKFPSSTSTFDGVRAALAAL